MKTTHQLLRLSAAVMSVVSSTTITPETKTSANIKQGAPGGDVVQTSRTTPRVISHDPR